MNRKYLAAACAAKSIRDHLTELILGMPNGSP